MGDVLSKKVSDKCSKGCVVHWCSKNRVLAVDFPSAVIERWHRARQQNNNKSYDKQFNFFFLRKAGPEIWIHATAEWEAGCCQKGQPSLGKNNTVGFSSPLNTSIIRSPVEVQVDA